MLLKVSFQNVQASICPSVFAYLYTIANCPDILITGNDGFGRDSRGIRKSKIYCGHSRCFTYGTMIVKYVLRVSIFKRQKIDHRASWKKYENDTNYSSLDLCNNSQQYKHKFNQTRNIELTGTMSDR